ncbi:exosortase F system-associated membrane protein [Ornithobacterium rhinotracheale]|uniref:exosortase F system-associated membrane protein n=1 Tax=Ornithobacterium rhinotracheale TaxID=28251 RepID=UPI00129C5A7E|nr:exosortase F system-associated protein [Ornithobacterium rhinotracheale]MRJ07847.1 exosortase F system-associated protein [Ornithobacterium rhinotracheale]UOH78638.1 exosortase F system-associated protein [Ornithobacterium rhinotracheale]
MKFLRWALVVVLIFALMAVRFFQTELFYDPLLAYFKTDYHHVAFPPMDLNKHLLSMLFRYGLNTLISLGIIALIFSKKAYVQFSALVYVVGALVFFGLYYYSLKTEFSSLGFTAGFYIRRLIIQPVMLLILIPVFLYTNHLGKKNR